MASSRGTVRLALACSWALAVACASTPHADPPVQSRREPVFFPEAPAPPRLQFLTSIASASGFGGGAEKPNASFAQWVAGRERGATPPSDRIQTPYGVDAWNGRLYVCDVGRNVVHVIDAATGRYTLLDPDRFKKPVNITIDRRDGTKYVCDTGADKVLVFDAHDRFVTEFGDPATMRPMDLAIDGDELYLVNTRAGRVEVWTRDGRRLRTFGRSGDGPDEFQGPANLAIGPDQRVYVTDMFAQQVKVFDRQGHYHGTIGEPGSTIGTFARPKGIAIDPHGHVYVSDAQWRVVQVFTPNDQLLAIISGMGGRAPGLVLPAALAIDATSLPAFRKYVHPDFEPQYLLFLVNQYGRNKVSVYAYGRSRSRPASDYVVPEAVTAPAP